MSMQKKGLNDCLLSPIQQNITRLIFHRVFYFEHLYGAYTITSFKILAT